MTEIKFVEMKDLKELVKKRIIHIEHASDDGEFVRFKILPNGPRVGMRVPDGPLQVVEGQTIHINIVNNFPQLFKES